MRWEKRRRSTNVEDRRGRSGGIGMPRGRVRMPRLPGGMRRGRGTRRAGGTSLTILIVVSLLLWVFAGISPLQLLEMLSGQSSGPVVTDSRTAPTPAHTPQQQAASDQQAEFLAVVLAETETTWETIFRQSGSRYAPPTLVLYDDMTETECGFGRAAAGPFYCPLDQKVYVDLSFFDLLSQRFGAPGDFAQAYVLAHEVGHHVQNLTGVLGEYQRQRQRMGERQGNALSVRVELQADCYAGVWAHAADRSGIVEDGDIDEALGAAAAVGDDVLQRRQQGYVVPESFNHGTAAQRSRWFRIGYQSGNPSACDTFDAADL